MKERLQPNVLNAGCKPRRNWVHDMVLCCTYTSTSLLFARQAQEALVALPDSFGIASVVALHRGLPDCIFLSYQHSQRRPLLDFTHR